MDIRYLLPVGLLLATPLVHAAPPAANPDSRTIPTGVSVTINVLANDSDPDGDGIQVVSVSGVETENATVILNDDGGIQVIPNTGVGSVEPEFIRFSYTVVDDWSNKKKPLATSKSTLSPIPSATMLQIRMTTASRRRWTLSVAS